MLIIEETGYGIYGKTVLSLQFFCKPKTIINFLIYLRRERERHRDINQAQCVEYV